MICSFRDSSNLYFHFAKKHHKHETSTTSFSYLSVEIDFKEIK